MIDSHIHLTHHLFNQTFPYLTMGEGKYKVQYGTKDHLVEELKASGVSCCIEPAIDAASNEKILALCDRYPGFLYPAMGNHPTRCIHSSLRDFSFIRELSKDPRVVAIGEAGLDYHLKREEQHRLRQKIWFLWQICLADERKLPLILHIRLAYEDALDILRKHKKMLHGGVCHCFNYGPEEAKAFVELGFCLGIGASLLGKEEIRIPLEKAVEETPLEYLLLETDGPYVKPKKPQELEELSGKQWSKVRNTGLILPAVAQRIAQLKGVSVEQVMKVTEENTRRVFGI